MLTFAEKNDTGNWPKKGNTQKGLKIRSKESIHFFFLSRARSCSGRSSQFGYEQYHRMRKTRLPRTKKSQIGSFRKQSGSVSWKF